LKGKLLLIPIVYILGILTVVLVIFTLNTLWKGLLFEVNKKDEQLGIRFEIPNIFYIEVANAKGERKSSAIRFAIGLDNNKMHETDQEYDNTLTDHKIIASSIAQCFNIGEVNFNKSYLHPQLTTYVNKNYPYPTLYNTENFKTIDLTTFHRSVVYLSNTISKLRVDTSKSTNENYSRMKKFQIYTVIIGTITTILISVKSISTTHTSVNILVGILAIVFSSIGTATSDLNSFYSPRESYVRNMASLASLRHLHMEIAAVVNKTALRHY
jgi:hypothetical protein